MKTKIISCNVHDHFEIACMHRSLVTLTFHHGETLIGQAIDLETKNKSEFLYLKVDQGITKQVNLLDIKILNVDNNDIEVC